MTCSKCRCAEGLAVFVLGASVGIVAEYLMDPVRGKRRRIYGRDQALSRLRHASVRLDRMSRYARGRAYGIMQAVMRLNPPDNPDPDDVTLANRVKSELFGLPGIPKGNLNIDSVRGVVILRGQIEDQPTVDLIRHRVARIPGVHGVASYLHLPNTPAPNRAMME